MVSDAESIVFIVGAQSGERSDWKSTDFTPSMRAFSIAQESANGIARISPARLKTSRLIRRAFVARFVALSLRFRRAFVALSLRDSSHRVGIRATNLSGNRVHMNIRLTKEASPALTTHSSGILLSPFLKATVSCPIVPPDWDRGIRDG
jgi:hypothetical protein